MWRQSSLTMRRHSNDKQVEAFRNHAERGGGFKYLINIIASPDTTKTVIDTGKDTTSEIQINQRTTPRWSSLFLFKVSTYVLPSLNPPKFDGYSIVRYNRIIM